MRTLLVRRRALAVLLVACLIAVVVPGVALGRSSKAAAPAPGVASAQSGRPAVLAHRPFRGPAVGAVFVESNDASGNMVLAFRRASDGALQPAGSFDTGGSGTGTHLASQGSVAISEQGKWLVAVNAGSNSISVFAVGKRGHLSLTDMASSMGTMPVSVSVVDNLVYVLNDGGSGNIAGFKLSGKGKLTFLAGSVQPLSNMGVGDAPTAHQIGIKPNRQVVVVTEQSTNLIDVYAMSGGVAGPPTSLPSVGAGPYGFAFSRLGKLVVSNAASGSLSSYRVAPATLSVISASVPDSGTAACWVTISPNGRLVYVSDAHSNDLSIYRLASSGALTLFMSPAATVQGPLDLDTTRGGRFLYVLASGTNTIDGFRVRRWGTLQPLGSLVTIPASAGGLVAW